MEKIHCDHKVMLQNKKSLSVFFRELLSFLDKSMKTFLQFDSQKIFVKHIKKLPQHFPEKFLSDNLSITDIA